VTRLIITAFIIGTTLFPSLLHAASPKDRRLERFQARLQATGKTYKRLEMNASKAMDKAFHRADGLLRHSKLAANIKTERLLSLRREKQVWESDHVLPLSYDMAATSISYVHATHDAAQAVSRAYAALIEFHTQSGNDTRAMQMADELQTFEHQLPGRGVLTSKTKWTGTRHGRNYNTRFSLWVGEMQGNVFPCHITQDRGRTHIDGEGTVNGNKVEIVTTRMKEGPDRKLRFEGIVMNNKIVLETSGMTTRRKQATGVVLLTRR